MIDFGLGPCPLCGGEAELSRLTQGAEHQSGVIKCTVCGLTLEWETPFVVGISRSGKRTVEKTGPDLVEAWNRRAGCGDCGLHAELNKINALHNCNDCAAVSSCPHRPPQGELVRINCPLWRAKED